MNTAIQNMFDRLPGVYERINHIVSLGLDVLWREKAASLASAKGGTAWLDVSTGTGEMADHLRRLAGPGTRIVATDFSMPMLMEAERKEDAANRKKYCSREPFGSKKPPGAPESGQSGEFRAGREPEGGRERKATHWSRAGREPNTDRESRSGEPSAPGPSQSMLPDILFLMAETGCLPFKPGSFDVVTMSLATRNIATSRENLVSCLKEFHRVLKPGGWFINLETSQPESPALRRLFHAYVGSFLRPVGAAISGSKNAYSYLASTIRGFYDAKDLSEIIKEAGFEDVSVTRLFFGVAAIHECNKIGTGD